MSIILFFAVVIVVVGIVYCLSNTLTPNTTQVYKLRSNTTKRSSMKFRVYIIMY